MSLDCTASFRSLAATTPRYSREEILSAISVPRSLNLSLSTLPRRESSSSAAGHSGVLTVVRRSCTKFSNRGR